MTKKGYVIVHKTKDLYVSNINHQGELMVSRSADSWIFKTRKDANSYLVKKAGRKLFANTDYKKTDFVVIKY